MDEHHKIGPDFLAPSPSSFQLWSRISVPMPDLNQEWTQTNIGLSWVSQPTGFPKPADKKGFPRDFNVLICRTPISHIHTLKLLQAGLPTHFCADRWSRKYLPRHVPTDLELMEHPESELAGRSVFLTLRFVAFKFNLGTQAYQHVGPSLLALTVAQITHMRKQVPVQIVILSREHPNTVITKREILFSAPASTQSHALVPHPIVTSSGRTFSLPNSGQERALEPHSYNPESHPPGKTDDVCATTDEETHSIPCTEGNKGAYIGETEGESHIAYSYE